LLNKKNYKTVKAVCEKAGGCKIASSLAGDR
jgi:hypothetical protein